MPVNAQLVVNIMCSQQLVCLLFGIHGLALFSLALLTLPLPLKLVIVLLLVLSLSYYVNRARDVVRIIVGADDEWFIQREKGVISRTNIIGSTYISGWLTLLVFRSLDRAALTYVCILKDSVPISVLSQLKLILKLSNHSS